jgi:hypothetical protein
LLDLRPEWSQDISEIVWNWNNSVPPPIRLLAEVGISGAQWIQDDVPILHDAYRDLSRERVQWTSTLNRVLWLGMGTRANGKCICGNQSRQGSS